MWITSYIERRSTNYYKLLLALGLLLFKYTTTLRIEKHGTKSFCLQRKAHAPCGPFHTKIKSSPGTSWVVPTPLTSAWGPSATPCRYVGGWSPNASPITGGGQEAVTRLVSPVALIEWRITPEHGWFWSGTVQSINDPPTEWTNESTLLWHGRQPLDVNMTRAPVYSSQHNVLDLRVLGGEWVSEYGFFWMRDAIDTPPLLLTPIAGPECQVLTDTSTGIADHYAV